MTLDDNTSHLNQNVDLTPIIEPIRVLHIDDEADQQIFLKVFVEGDQNIKVTSAKSIEDTLELINSGAYDCLISDYDMPRWTG